MKIQFDIPNTKLLPPGEYRIRITHVEPALNLEPVLIVEAELGGPVCKYCGGRVDEAGQVHAGGCGK